jgi:hypothetical protein
MLEVYDTVYIGMYRTASFRNNSSGCQYTRRQVPKVANLHHSRSKNFDLLLLGSAPPFPVDTLRVTPVCHGDSPSPLNIYRPYYFNTCTVRLVLFCTLTNKCTITQLLLQQNAHFYY